MPGVLDDDAHACLAILVGEVSENPDAGVAHLDDRGDAFGGAQPQHRHGNGFRQRIAVQGDNGEGVPGQSEAAVFGGAAVEHVHQDPVAGLHLDRDAVAEGAAVDGKALVADLVTVRCPRCQRRGHRLLAPVAEFRNRVTGQEAAGHVAALAQRGLEFLEREEHFAVIGARLVFGLDVDRADQAPVLATGQVRARVEVGVVEAEARRARHKGDLAHAARRDERGALLGRAINVNR